MYANMQPYLGLYLVVRKWLVVSVRHHTAALPFIAVLTD